MNWYYIKIIYKHVMSSFCHFKIILPSINCLSKEVQNLISMNNVMRLDEKRQIFVCYTTTWHYNSLIPVPFSGWNSISYEYFDTYRELFLWGKRPHFEFCYHAIITNTSETKKIIVWTSKYIWIIKFSRKYIFSPLQYEKCLNILELA